MIAGRQIRAARALLDMSQDDLAQSSGLTPQAIRKIEDGSVQPRLSTIADITRVFHERGVEFTDYDGVRFRPEGLEILSGHTGLIKLLDDVYDHLKLHGGRVLVTGVKNEDWVKNIGDYSAVHIPRMTELVRQRSDIEILSLAPEGDKIMDYSSYTKYRYQSIEHFDPVPFYIYGDNLAIIDFRADPTPKIIIVKSATVAQAFTKQFNQLWQLARPISRSM